MLYEVITGFLDALGLQGDLPHIDERRNVFRIHREYAAQGSRHAPRIAFAGVQLGKVAQGLYPARLGLERGLSYNFV